ncbi:MAG: hypothetical protein EHM21_07825 [Chloroflexi bacterium]|nr:MAG: hypothetical protein EHM21_07825 [Chloroflexota bacterium]
MTNNLSPLHNLALTALQNYDLDIRDIRLVGQFTNTIFRAKTGDGKSYLVRLCRPGWRTLVDLRSEAAWMEALSRDPSIGAPAPVRDRNGEFVVEFEGAAAGVIDAPDLTAALLPEMRGEPPRCMVTTWIPGVSMEKRMTEENFTKLGELFTRLHEHALGISPPPGFTTRRMDSIYARGEADELFSERFRSAFTPRSREIYERTRQVVEAAYASLFRQPGMRPIHNDLAQGNVLVYRGRLHPLDFEDTIWGYPVHDIAYALFDLSREVPPDDYERLRACFRAGYESRLPWPESAPGQIDAFCAGRMIWVTNYVALYEEEYLEQHIAWNARVFEHFLESGEVSFRYR